MKREIDVNAVVTSSRLSTPFIEQDFQLKSKRIRLIDTEKSKFDSYTFEKSFQMTTNPTHSFVNLRYCIPVTEGKATISTIKGFPSKKSYFGEEKKEEFEDQDGQSYVLDTILDKSNTKIDERNNVLKKNDISTGIIYEVGELHFDRHNRFRQERPLRITKIKNYLEQSKKIQGGYTVLEGTQKSEADSNSIEKSSMKKETSSGREFLENEDYLRVHLPGYMRR